MTSTEKKLAKSEPFNPEHGSFIDALGGPAVVAGFINEHLRAHGKDPISDEAVSNMKRRGVSQPYRYLLAKKAAAGNVPLPPNFLVGM